MEIILRDLVKAYGNREVININDFVFKENKTYGIIGSNGAGKTTLIRMILGLDRDYKGSIDYRAGTSYITLEEVRKKAGYVSQNPYLFDQSIRENVKMGIKFQGENNKNEIDEILSEFKLTDISERNALNISMGEAQRTAVARVMLAKSEILLFDEPTANIDSQNTKVIEEAIINYKKKNTVTIIIVTHNIFQAKRLCDYIIYMENGRILEVIDRKEFHCNKKLQEIIEYSMIL
ncbi:hypothetical protein Q428_07225 [Fervidicella metallireducens AeB]|uniref:ABC transporter domain-containing protein n=1 Tax=Fervidicella metallireducens AeB TaxID=1403537 RepID=A0A017RXD8_9CLOT|nr:ATP-binding cassette domain-containing protein [Fervidicella metallireducens]EYE88575.1 hypothetical protein Q428_07225 [Fervidicella metallireducens AeB]